MLQKYSRRPEELGNKIKLIYGKLDSVRNKNFLRSIFVYSLELVEFKTIKKVLLNSSPTVKNKVMTAYDTLIQMGMEKGMEKEWRSL